MPSKFLRFFRPFTRIMPEAKAPDREVSFKEKLIWTAVVLVIYLIMSNVPLYGIDVSDTTDYFYWMRVILASQRGRLTEFGIGPIVTAGLVMQLLVGSKIINVDMSDPVERGLFSGVQKVMAILLTIAQAIAYLLGGAFGSLTPVQNILVFLQLLFATVILMLMDEMIQKGWGLGSGVSLFIGANVAGQILYNAFSFFPDPNITEGDPPAWGAMIAFFQSFFTDKITFSQAFIRTENQPDMLGIITTIIVFLVVVWFESMRIEIPLSYKGYSGFKGKYPMKLMYVSNIPVILSQALYANVLFFAQLIAAPNSGPRDRRGASWDPFFNLIGKFEELDGGQLRPTGGLAYYLTPPQGISAIVHGEAGEIWQIVTHAFVYLGIFMALCIVLGKIWIEVSGLAPRDIARQILGSKMQIDGFRSSEKVIEKILARYIPTLTVINGILVAVLSFGADFLGALGSGTGLLLMVGIMQNFAETIAKEAASEQYPTLAGFMGK